MPNDRQVVSAQIVFQSLLILRRQGRNHLLEQLENTEPELTEYLLETISLIDQELPHAGGSPRATRKLRRRIESLCLVCILAVRKGHYELWKRTSMGDELVTRDPSLAQEIAPEGPGTSLPPASSN